MFTKLRDHLLLDPVRGEFYQTAIRLLLRAEVPFLVGGAYSFAHVTGLERHTKDFDIFVRPATFNDCLGVLEQAGYEVEATHPHWLGKVFCGESCMDVIFGGGNGIAGVDDGWFEHALPARVFDTEVWLCPVEETIWSKSFVMERERFDGADIAHLIRAAGRRLDWQRLLDRFGPHWRVLLAHLAMFGFVYPSERDVVPAWLLDELIDRLLDPAEADPAPRRVCQGTLLSRAQYLVDVEIWGYQDGRVVAGAMSRGDIDRWTDAIATERPTPATRPVCRSG